MAATGYSLAEYRLVDFDWSSRLTVSSSSIALAKGSSTTADMDGVAKTVRLTLHLMHTSGEERTAVLECSEAKTAQVIESLSAALSSVTSNNEPPTRYL
eukprot:ANDGO_05147.mRNA.1 hypothetical protein